jgi:hypothetical protein
MDLKFWVDFLGWVGTVSYLLAYALLSAKKLPADSLRYQWMNLVGGVFLVINGAYFGAYPSVGLNLVWVGITLFAMFANRKPSSRRIGGQG